MFNEYLACSHEIFASSGLLRSSTVLCAATSSVCVVLPKWLSVPHLQAISLWLAIGAVLLGFILVWKVQKAALRATLLVLALIVAGGAYMYRSGLEDCRKTASCSFLGYNVPTKS